MTKKLILLAGAAAACVLAVGASQANATTATSPAGLTFTVGAACTLTGNVANLGNYNVGDTVATYAGRQGKYVGGATTAGTDAPVTLATVSCPTGTVWSVVIQGTGVNNSVTVLDPTSTPVFLAYAYQDTLNGVAQAGYINGNAAGLSSTSTGTGAAQVLAGHYIVNAPTAAQLSTAFIQGTYTGAATATLTY